jgi:asparagine synthase (glutamine-hydrolysing)
MCGIVGIAGQLNKQRLSRAIRAMNDSIAHRGPDDEGLWVGDNFAFGMRRLSIIDLAGGHQPMWDSGSGTGIVYNGEIYNYRGVRASLSKSGVQFETNSDTEVALKSLVHGGHDAVHDWNGMFAVATWNDRERKLLLIRDRVGVKPLYYFWDGQTLMFASEIKALLASGLCPRRVNTDAIWDYLTFRYVPSPSTIWKNIWKLPPGHMLEWSPDSAPSISCYWKTDVVSSRGGSDFEQKTREFEELFLDSVSQRLLASDVPVGIMLSGGLDSSTIAAAAVELGHKRFHTFSVGFSEGGEYSELAFAREVARHLQVENHEVVIDQPTFIEMLPEAVQFADEPLADLTIVPLLAVSRLAREHVKVALSGEGADEILAGYALNVSQRKFETIRRMQKFPGPLLTLAGRVVAPISQQHADKIAAISTIPLSQWNLAHKNHMTWYFDEWAKMALWPKGTGRSSELTLKDIYATAGSTDPLDQMLSAYQKSWLVEDLLMKADKMSMAASLEVRVPFLDYRLVEWANRQPMDVKIGPLGGKQVTKRILRRFAQKRLPESIIARPKRGFPVPVYHWLSEPQFATWAVEQLLGNDAKLRHLFRVSELEQLLSRASEGNLDAANKVWLLIVLETWMRAFQVDVKSDSAAFRDGGRSAAIVPQAGRAIN